MGIDLGNSRPCKSGKFIDNFKILIFSHLVSFVAIQCDTCQIYEPCGPSNPRTCRNLCQSTLEQLPIDCVEGCFCANNTVIHQGKCVKPSECPCYLNGMMYEKDTFIIRDCQTWYVVSQVSTQRRQNVMDVVYTSKQRCVRTRNVHILT